MRLLVLSDTHGYIHDELIKKINSYDTFDYLIHCGDYYRDLIPLKNSINAMHFIGVNGNCDFSGTGKNIEILNIEGAKIIVTHGHLFGVKRDMDSLRDYAVQQSADAVLFGHTHERYSQYIDNILFYNPGSACMPRRGACSFGILKVKNGLVYDETVEY